MGKLPKSMKLFPSFWFLSQELMTPEPKIVPSTMKVAGRVGQHHRQLFLFLLKLRHCKSERIKNWFFKHLPPRIVCHSLEIEFSRRGAINHSIISIWCGWVDALRSWFRFTVAPGQYSVERCNEISSYNCQQWSIIAGCHGGCENLANTNAYF